MGVLCGTRGNTWWTRSSTPGMRRLVLLTLILGTHVCKMYSASPLVLFLSASCSWDGGSQASAQLTLNFPWMFSLNVPWMLPCGQVVFCVNLGTCLKPFLQLGLGAHGRPPQLELNVHWMFPECSLNVPGMFPECSLMFPECSRNVPWMFPECSPNVPWCSLNVPECSPNVPWCSRQDIHGNLGINGLNALSNESS
jgi:hypothetical protein